jgi:hypothetical protein
MKSKDYNEAAEIAKLAPGFAEKMKRFLEGARHKLALNNAQYEIDACKKALEIEVGRKYIRVWSLYLGGSVSRSAYCFVDMGTGDVLKAATWRTPAKHARGNIFAEDAGVSAVSAYGAVYLR